MPTVLLQRKELLDYQKLLFTVLENKKDFASLGGILKMYVTYTFATVFGNLKEYNKQINSGQPESALLVTLIALGCNCFFQEVAHGRQIIPESLQGNIFVFGMLVFASDTKFASLVTD